MTTEPLTVLIIGAGFAGLGTAIRLKQAGIDDFVILERSDEVGGLAYDDAAGTWTATLADGRNYTARTVVSAAGPLANVSFPKLKGIDTYTGHKIHSARWDHDYDFAGKRVAVIGTGASAVQIIPELVKRASQVKVFQRTPGWVMPRLDFRHPGWLKAAFRHVPASQVLARQALFWGHEAMALGLVRDSAFTTAVQSIARAYLRAAVKDPWLRRQLTPDFRIGCKRLLSSSDYYPALQQDNCKLITWPIATLSPSGIRTAEGIEHEADCIVFATGFDVCKTSTPFPITGRGGRLLADEWAGGAQVYKSVNVAGYPNLFLTFGPNSGPGHNSALVYMESQIGYIIQAIRLMLERDLAGLDDYQVVPTSRTTRQTAASRR